MLGYVRAAGQGEADRLLAAVARDLMAQGWPLAGAVQVNVETRPASPCDMELHVLSLSQVVPISQRLGAMARGCRLDPEGLEHAAGLVERALDNGPRLLIINKFGKQEAEGRGFRPLIGVALGRAIPVLTCVSDANLAAFEAFAGGMGEPLPGERDAVIAWCRSVSAACQA